MLNLVVHIVTTGLLRFEIFYRLTTHANIGVLTESLVTWKKHVIGDVRQLYRLVEAVTADRILHSFIDSQWTA